MSHPRRTHRKRTSALHLSSDTTASLPEYFPWHNPAPVPSDQPPDYPDSAEEADEDTDTDSNSLYTFPPPSAPNSPRLHGYASSPSPRRNKRFVPTHKRKHSLPVQQQQEPSDPYLDALLERSVHALEMSNTLLQSSISTQTSLSTVLACDSPSDTTLETRAMNLSLSSRIRDGWSEDLDEITKDVDILFPRDVEESGPASSRRQRKVGSAHGLEGSLSCSLPSSSSSVLKKSSRRPSLDLRLASSEESAATPRLNYTAQHRANLIAPPPRALTQYITDADNIFPLPSTLGLRLPQAQHAQTPECQWKPLSEFASSSMTSLSLPPKLTDKPLEPSTPAYAMLSSFVYRAPSSAGSATATPSSSFTPSFISNRRLDGSPSKERRSAERRCSRSPSSHRSPDKVQQHQRHQERPGRTSHTPLGSPSVSVLHRPMTPPVEESSSSSDGVVAKQTVKCLRKILDDQPQPPPLSSRSSSLHRFKPPAFMPRTPAPVAEAGISTATASVSRLFTKGTHSSSTRAPSPPLQSAMKRSASDSASPSTSGSSSATHSKANSLSLNTTPSPSPTVLSIPDMVSKVLGGGTPSSSSGTSTPTKRISFAQLPESYGSSSSKFKEKQELSRRKRASRKDSSKGKGRLVGEGGSSRKDQPSKSQGWWNGWLAMDNSNLHGLNMTLARQQERMEDRTTRSWGGRMSAGFGGGLDEWAV